MIEHKGNLYARVSDVLSQFSDFGHIDPAVLEIKKNIGTHVHKAIESYISGTFMPLPIGCEGYFESFLGWNKAVSPTYEIAERRLFCSQRRLTGQIDALVSIQGEAIPVLIDFKTSAQESPVVWIMQAHLYAYLLEVNELVKEPLRRFLFLRLQKNGKLPCVHRYPRKESIDKQCERAVLDYWLKHSGITQEACRL